MQGEGPSDPGVTSRPENRGTAPVCVDRTGGVGSGFTRVVWGRLDEIQPTDVINPLDVSRFFFEGRAEARLPVALVRGSCVMPGLWGFP